MRRAAVIPFVLTLLLVGGSAPAGARTPGTWALLSPSAGPRSVAQPWPLRETDGSLLVAYDDPSGAGSVLTSTISRSGDIAQGPRIADGWASVGDPALLATSGGLGAFFRGQHSTDTTDPNRNLNAASAPGPGGPWAVAPGSVATAQDAEDVSYGAPVAAMTLGDGTPFEAWGSTLGLFVHRGLDPALPEQDYQAQLGGCCGYDAQLAVDGSSGNLAVTWYSNASGHHGVWYQAVDPATAAPSGSPALVPGTSAGDRGVDLRGRVPFTGCAGQPGTWVAAQVGYPSQSRVVLWRAGAATASTLDTGGDEVRNVALSCGPDGRLWVAWVRNAPLSLHMVRSNRERTEFGAEAVVPLPRGSVDAYRLAAAAQPGLLDVVASIGSTKSTALRAIQVQPALDVAVRTTTSVRRGGTATVKATVTDAGDPVRGVVLSLAGHRVRTNRRGVATVHVRHVRRSHRYRMTASLRGFTPGVAATRVKVRR